MSQLAGLTIKQINEISPRNPHPPDVYRLDEKSTFKELHEHLWLIRANYEYYPAEKEVKACLDDNGEPSTILLYPYPISFEDEHEKRNWNLKRGSRSFKTFRDFIYGEKLNWQKHRLAFFCCKNPELKQKRSLVWTDHPFECWGALLEDRCETRENMGFNLYIYDCSAQLRYKAGRTVKFSKLPIMQQKFIRFLQQQYNLNNILIVPAIGGNPEGEGVKFTAQFVEQTMKDESIGRVLPFNIDALIDGGCFQVTTKRKQIESPEDEASSHPASDCPSSKRRSSTGSKAKSKSRKQISTSPVEETTPRYSDTQMESTSKSKTGKEIDDIVDNNESVPELVDLNQRRTQGAEERR